MYCSLVSFPVYKNEEVSDAVFGSYLYGSLRLGSSLVRNVLLFPSSTPETSSNTLKHPIDTKVYLIPGLDDTPRFHDLLVSSTFTIEVHQDDLLERALNAQRLQEYSTLVSSEPGGLGLPVAPPSSSAAPAAPAPGKKAPAAKAAPVVAEVAAFSPVATNATKSDLFLLEALHRELESSRQIRSHGVARFRLEQLLQQSSDLLAKFQRRRHAEDEARHVTVQEDLMLEVRLQKPSRPDKWTLPADMSLKAALETAKARRGKQERPKVIKQPPRHELFLLSGTFLSATAELFRHVHEDAHQVDSASPFPLQLTLSSSTKAQRHEARNLSDTQLQDELSKAPFTRMIFVTKYDNDAFLEALNEGIHAVNSRALPNIQGSIRSYSLTAQELEAARGGALDVVSGFMVIDDDLRLIVLEGLAAPDKAMETLYLDYLPRQHDNDEQLTILANPEVLFQQRTYAEYSPDIKRIRVRGKLQRLARRPEIYNRLQVDEVCFEAVDRLTALQRSQDLRSTKQLDVFPSATALNTLELLYGEAISRADMDGTLQRAFVQHAEDHKARKELRSSSAEDVNNNANTNTNNTAANRTSQRASDKSLSASASRRKAFEFTDCRNADFELHLRTRPAHRIDYLAEQRALRKQAWLNMLHRRDVRDKALTSTIRSVLGLSSDANKDGHRDAAGRDATRDRASGEAESEEAPRPKIYLYANQSLNFKMQAWNQLREQIAADKNATYTLSKDFMSQNVSVVDDAQEKKRLEAEEKQKRLTQKGFQYPKPKTRKELLTHPQRPSEARIEDLKEPFFDATDVRRGGAGGGAPGSAEEVAREKGFRTQIPVGGLFGALEAPRFETEFQLKLVGDRDQLPRGSLLNADTTDHAFFRSVHLGGENQRRVVEEAQAQEKADWLAKVVVEDVAFKVGGFKVRDRPIAVDRCADILHDEPKRGDLQHLREKRGHRGTSLAYTTTPLSILNVESYAPQAGQKLLTRRANPTKFVTATLRDGDRLLEGNNGDSEEVPRDFQRYIHADTNRAKIVSMVAKRKHPPLDTTSSECRGAKWDPA